MIPSPSKLITIGIASAAATAGFFVGKYHKQITAGTKKAASATADATVTAAKATAKAAKSCIPSRKKEEDLKQIKQVFDTIIVEEGGSA